MSAPRLKRRNATWHVSFTAADGTRIRCSARTADRAEAEAFAAQLWKESYQIAALGRRPRYSWDDAVVRWISDHGHKKSIGKDRGNLRWLDPHLGGVLLDQIDTERLRAIRVARTSQDISITKRGPASVATANRTLALVRSILRAAAGWGWLDRVPVVPMGTEARGEPEYLTRAQADEFLQALSPHWHPMVRFALATGLREQNVLRLRWGVVDMEARSAWVRMSETKAGRSLRVPLAAEAMVVLRQQREFVAKSCPWVFPKTPTGEPYARAVTTGWRAARESTKLHWVGFHTLRHTWASWHVMAGTPLEVLQRLGGWASLDMVLRYAHLAPSHVDSYAARAGGPRAVETVPERKVKA